MNKKMVNTLLLSLFVLSSTACTSSSSSSSDQGSQLNPVNIGTYPVSNYSGKVDKYILNSSGDSFYQVDGIAPGGTYTITLSNASGYLYSMIVYDGSYSQQKELCQHYTTGSTDTTFSCSTNQLGSAPSGTYLTIHIENKDNKVVNYNLSVN